MVLPGCQDTGTAICMGSLIFHSYFKNIYTHLNLFENLAKKGQHVWTDGDDASHISRGVYNTYTKRNLRYSQVAPIDMFTEKNTGTNLPAQIDIYSQKGNSYDFLYVAKGIYLKARK